MCYLRRVTAERSTFVLSIFRPIVMSLDGAQGRNRTSDTRIFSLQKLPIYQLLRYVLRPPCGDFAVSLTPNQMVSID